MGLFDFEFRLEKFRPGRDLALRRFGIAEAAFLLMMAYLASRGLGVIRQTLFNALFGTGPQANAYYAAFRLPDLLFSLIAGGALIQAFVPVFVSYEKEHGQSETWRLTSLVFNVSLVALTSLVLIAEFAAPAFVSHWLVPGYSPAEQNLTTSLTRIMLFHTLILGLGTIVTGVLESKRQFLLPALSIAIYNFALIGGLLVTWMFPKVGIYGPTYGVVAGAACQVLIQIPGLVKQKFRYSFFWDLKNAGLHQVMFLLGPNLVAVGISSIVLVIDTAFTSYLPDKASLSAIHNAFMLFDLPAALLGQTLALAALPQLSSLNADRHFLHFRHCCSESSGSCSDQHSHRNCVEYFWQASYSYPLPTWSIYEAFGIPNDIGADRLCCWFTWKYSFVNFDAQFLCLEECDYTPLDQYIALAAHISLLVFLLKSLTGTYMILAIPLAAGITATPRRACLVCCFYGFCV